jgi:hypothetical protein
MKHENHSLLKDVDRMRNQMRYQEEERRKLNEESETDINRMKSDNILLIEQAEHVKVQVEKGKQLNAQLK